MTAADPLDAIARHLDRASAHLDAAAVELRDSHAEVLALVAGRRRTGPPPGTPGPAAGDHDGG